MSTIASSASRADISIDWAGIATGEGEEEGSDFVVEAFVIAVRPDSRPTLNRPYFITSP